MFFAFCPSVRSITTWLPSLWKRRIRFVFNSGNHCIRHALKGAHNTYYENYRCDRRLYSMSARRGFPSQLGHRHFDEHRWHDPDPHRHRRGNCGLFRRNCQRLGKRGGRQHLYQGSADWERPPDDREDPAHHFQCKAPHGLAVDDGGGTVGYCGQSRRLAGI
ncbi:hypothetical protein SDC9_201101 [bioreactor metagenome]|uniref:Uncharacterized protein n=1 Tax=bioreactor metagenome TaxID=1076179 RepID=A0A645IQC9_9ZZZZ